MGRRPCCEKEGMNRGAWTAIEDKILIDYISVNGEGKWRNLPKKAGLKRCGKSCRLRWLNYLRPDIKRGNITHDEEELIIRLHKLLGNRWSLIAGRLTGRTDNEIKNYWNTKIQKKFQNQQTNQKIHSSSDTKKSPPQKPTFTSPKNCAPKRPLIKSCNKTNVIRTKAIRCTRVVMPQEPKDNIIDQRQQNYDNKPILVEPRSPSMKNYVSSTPDDHKSSSESSLLWLTDSSSSNLNTDFGTDDRLLLDFLGMDFLQLASSIDLEDGTDCHDTSYKCDNGGKLSTDHQKPLMFSGDLVPEPEFSSVDSLIETEFDWLGD